MKRQPGGGERSSEIVGLHHVQLAMPSGQARPAFLVRGLTVLASRSAAAGVPPVSDEPLKGFHRLYVSDPFGNRIELLEPLEGR